MDRRGFFRLSAALPALAAAPTLPNPTGLRLSADSSHPYYNPLLAPRATVYLNGERLEHCITASEPDGWVECHMTDANCHMIQTHVGGCEIDYPATGLPTAKLYGKVRIDIGGVK